MRSLSIFILVLLLPASVLAHDYEIGSLSVEHPWARATVPTAEVGAGYMIIENSGDEMDRLIAVEAETVAGRIELHEMVNQDGVMKMRPLAMGIVVPPAGEAVLVPGGLHVMFLGLKGPLVEGERLPATLVFEKAGRLAVEFKVEAMDYLPDGHDHGSGS